MVLGRPYFCITSFLGTGVTSRRPSSLYVSAFLCFPVGSYHGATDVVRGSSTLGLGRGGGPLSIGLRCRHRLYWGGKWVPMPPPLGRVDTPVSWASTVSRRRLVWRPARSKCLPPSRVCALCPTTRSVRARAVPCLSPVSGFASSVFGRPLEGVVRSKSRFGDLDGRNYIVA